MTGPSTIGDRLRAAAILLSGVVPLSLQAGPLVGSAVAARQVDRLLEDVPAGSEVPQELVLQCHLISLISDAVTLRADHADTSGLAGALVPFSIDIRRTTVGEPALDRPDFRWDVDGSFRLSDVKPQGP